MKFSIYLGFLYIFFSENIYSNTFKRTPHSVASSSICIRRLEDVTRSPIICIKNIQRPFHVSISHVSGFAVREDLFLRVQ